MTPRTVHAARLAVLLVTISLSATTLLWVLWGISKVIGL